MSEASAFSVDSHESVGIEHHQQRAGGSIGGDQRGLIEERVKVDRKRFEQMLSGRYRAVL